jgi:hypothetical protein
MAIIMIDRLKFLGSVQQQQRHFLNGHDVQMIFRRGWLIAILVH